MVTLIEIFVAASPNYSLHILIMSVFYYILKYYGTRIGIITYYKPY
jgi:hypothetical protein